MERKDNTGFLAFVQKLFHISPYYDGVDVHTENEIEGNLLVENFFQLYDQVTVIEPDESQDIQKGDRDTA